MKERSLLGVAATGACLALAAAGLAAQAWGFAVEGPRRSTGDALRDLRLASRWSWTEQSLVAGGERGLGGGLEYALDDSLCRLKMADGSSCEEVLASVRRAFAVWGRGHPVLDFVDVSEEIAPVYASTLSPSGPQGAEIDVFAATPAEYPAFRSALMNGYTVFFDQPDRNVRLADGRPSEAVYSLQSADIRVNAARCYYLDPEWSGDAACVHLPSLMLHEIGHALGLAHPEERPGRNLDRNEDPDDALEIDCRDPTSGLRVSYRTSAFAVLKGTDVQGPDRWINGLSADDIASRNALYPACAPDTPRLAER